MPLYPLLFAALLLSACTSASSVHSEDAKTEQLREHYSGPVDTWPKPHLDKGIEHRPLGPIPAMEYPKDNPYSKPKATLGKVLFFDPRLSGEGHIACASCHSPEHGWADGNRRSFGHKRLTGNRNAPTIINSGYAKTLFWDGRAKDLEDQALGPIINPVEMHASLEEMVKRLDAIKGYKPLFQAAFGNEAITKERVAKAIATFERTIVSRKSPFDHFLAGERYAISDKAVRGLHLFRTKARCINCHSGPLFTDDKFHNLGISFYGKKLQDLGRYNVTKTKEDVSTFRTPALRDIALTAPYFHNGIVIDLPNLVKLYNSGMGRDVRTKALKNDPLFPEKSPHIKRLHLTLSEREDLVAFLESISKRQSPTMRRMNPKLPQ